MDEDVVMALDDILGAAVAAEHLDLDDNSLNMDERHRN